MKIGVIVGCGLLGATAATAQVSLSGIMDTNVARGWASGPGSKSLNQVGNSGLNSSRLIISGREDLGDGAAASFWLEAGINSDDGTGVATNTNNQASGIVNNGLQWNRRSTVSLSSNTWGELRMGRDYTPAFLSHNIFDPYGSIGVGTTQTFAGVSIPLAAARGPIPAGAQVAIPGSVYFNSIRASNSFGYFLPSGLRGFYGQAMYFLGENARDGSPTQRDGDGYGVRGGYSAGPVNVAAAWQKTKYARLGDLTTWNLGGQWTFDLVRLVGLYNTDKFGGSTLANGIGSSMQGRSWMLGAVVPVGLQEFKVTYSTYKLDMGGGIDPKTSRLALGYVYNFSKRTAAYGTFAELRNRNGANQTLLGSSVPAADLNPHSGGYQVGLRHIF